MDHYVLHNEFGTIFGYSVPIGGEFFHSYFSRMCSDQEFNQLEEALTPWFNQTIALCRAVRVEDHCRHQGYGTSLMKEWLSLVPHPVLLIADSESSFDLKPWYQRLGFNSLLPTHNGWIMEKGLLVGSKLAKLEFSNGFLSQAG